MREDFCFRQLPVAHGNHHDRLRAHLLSEAGMMHHPRFGRETRHANHHRNSAINLFHGRPDNRFALQIGEVGQDAGASQGSDRMDAGFHHALEKSLVLGDIHRSVGGEGRDGIGNDAFERSIAAHRAFTGWGLATTCFPISWRRAIPPMFCSRGAFSQAR